MERVKIMDFAEAMRKGGSFTLTENGAVALSTTGDARLDLFSSIGSLREADRDRIHMLFDRAYQQDALFATKIVFYARDVRGGLGERETFRILLRHMAKRYPEALRLNLDLIGVFGRYDDLYALIGTSLENEMWDAMKRQFEEDWENLNQGKTVSLLAKWIKTADSHNQKTRRLGILTAQKLGYSVYEFKRMVRKLRKQIGVVEVLMSEGQWDKIKYPEVPSRAMMIYRDAFLRHDKIRFQNFLTKAEKGEAKINASALFPYDIVQKFLFQSEDSKVLEVQWKALPDYVKKGTNALVMADVSGSMFCANGRPMATSIGLAIYFAERNVGAYHNMFLTFSSQPKIVIVKGKTLREKIHNVKSAEWGMNTDLKAAFDKVLQIAIENHVSADEMPKSIIVISDMEIDRCGNREWTFYDKMASRFQQYGYQIPNIIFWNVNSRHDIFHVSSNKKGVQLASGQSVTVFQQILANLGYNPVEAMENTICAKRYDCIMVDKII